MVALFYIKKEEDSLYFWYFQKIVDSDMCIIGLLWIELRKLKEYSSLKKTKKDDKISENKSLDTKDKNHENHQTFFLSYIWNSADRRYIADRYHALCRV